MSVSPNSCNLCVDDKSEDKEKLPCEDHNSEQCLLWGEQECAHNTESMLTLCPNLCGACTLACADTHKDCPGWAKGKDGTACDTTPHLPAACPQSCGICAGIHVKKPPEKKQEL